jgi:uncharacterized flavoprotein (TIGR03862 family)
LNQDAATTVSAKRASIVIVGAGPAGLMAAEALANAGHSVAIYDAMPSVGRKFLLAGKGGLNLTHSEAPDIFASRYGHRRAAVEPWINQFGATQIRDWAKGLGIDTFVGTSARVFPTDMKAAPLLRAWLRRLRPRVQFHARHRWTGWSGLGTERLLQFDSPAGQVHVQADAVVLALGGGSWSRLGSDGAWVAPLRAQGIGIAPLRPSNCGFDVMGGWSEHFSSRFAGQPFKSVAISFTDSKGHTFARKGEFVATATGVEGSLIYAASSLLRDEIAAHGSATFQLDLLPDRSVEKVLAEVNHPRGSRSLSSHLKSRLGLEGIKSTVLHERLSKDDFNQPHKLAAAMKALPITLSATRPIDEAISSAGGVMFEGLDAQLMLTKLPGVFCAGEMLDWEAPTGGYLLTASLASGYCAGRGVLNYLNKLKSQSA